MSSIHFRYTEKKSKKSVHTGILKRILKWRPWFAWMGCTGVSCICIQAVPFLSIDMQLLLPLDILVVTDMWGSQNAHCLSTHIDVKFGVAAVSIQPLHPQWTWMGLPTDKSMEPLCLPRRQNMQGLQMGVLLSTPMWKRFYISFL